MATIDGLEANEERPQQQSEEEGGHVEGPKGPGQHDCEANEPDGGQRPFG